MKTIREWLSELPEPYRSQALDYENQQSSCWDVLVKCKSDALSLGLVWWKTKEGYDYWDTVFSKVKLNEIYSISPNSPNSSLPIPQGISA